ncbi:hypothetical protein CPC08DRAFT_765609 [Agrocybe pediades]|nr:hypothetical protein CPC08DRAFT_765609 [Agrocybe pediades]
MSVRRFVGDSDEEHNSALIQRIYGPLELGGFFAMILYGVLLVQIYSYYMTYKSDQRKVLYLLIVETIHSALVMGMVYQPLVLDFGQRNSSNAQYVHETNGSAYTAHRTSLRLSLLSAFGEMNSKAILTVFISAPIQVLVAWRLWNIQQSIWIAAAVVVLSAVSTAGGLWTGIQVAMIRLYEKSPQAYPAIYMWLGSAAAADMLITASLSCILYRRRTGSPASDAVLTRIILFTIQNGLVTSIAAILDIVLLVAFPNIAINWIFEVVLVKLYANTLMSSLNSRQSLNKEWNNRESLMFNQRLDILDTTQNTDILQQGVGVLASRSGQIKSMTNAAGIHLQQNAGLKIEFKQEV